MKKKRQALQDFFNWLDKDEIKDFEFLVLNLKKDLKIKDKTKKEVILQYCPADWDNNMAGWLLKNI